MYSHYICEVLAAMQNNYVNFIPCNDNLYQLTAPFIILNTPEILVLSTDYY